MYRKVVLKKTKLTAYSRRKLNFKFKVILSSLTELFVCLFLQSRIRLGCHILFFMEKYCQNLKSGSTCNIDFGPKGWDLSLVRYHRDWQSTPEDFTSMTNLAHTRCRKGIHGYHQDLNYNLPITSPMLC